MILNLDAPFARVAEGRLPIVTLPSLERATVEQKTAAQGIVTRLDHRLTREVLEAFPKLRFVATITTGLDQIDLDACRDRGIQVLSLKGETRFLETIRATPEHTWALLLALLRRLPAAHQAVCDGRWGRAEFLGNELSGKTLGILGFGRVGKIVAGYGRAFGMTVVAHDVVPVDEARFEVRSVALQDLFRQADVLSIHVPLERATVRMVGAELLALLKPEAVVINTARGAILDEAALLDALRNRRIAGAALDVLDEEWRVPEQGVSHPLIAYAGMNPNLLLTPHIAGSTHESLHRTAGFILEKIEKLLAAQPRA